MALESSHLRVVLSTTPSFHVVTRGGIFSKRCVLERDEFISF